MGLPNHCPVILDNDAFKLLFITDADGEGGGEEWLEAMTRTE